MLFGQSMRWAGRSAMALTLFAAFGLGAPALAQSEGEQPAAAEGEAPPQGADVASGWRKVAVPNPQDASNPIVLVSQEARDDNNVPIAEVTIVMEPGKDKRMLIVVPQGFLLPPGIRLQVDQNEPLPGQYITCMANTCQAEAQVNDDFITQMKKGANLVVAVATLPEGKGRGVGLSLKGFTAAFDGEPLDIEKYKAERQAFNDLLKQRAEANRRRLQEQQQQQAAGSGGEGPAEEAAPAPEGQ